MLKLLYSLIYLGVLGILCFPAGRWFANVIWNPDLFPFKEHRWEDGGKIYDRLLKIKKWKDKVPDVSKWLPNVVPRKKLTRPSIEELDDMIQETCVAELIHMLLCVLSVPVLFISPGITGIAVLILDVFLGNLPFAIIQRYNRFRYLKTRRKCESINTKL